MNLDTTLSVYGGGPGSGCAGPNCGRPGGSGSPALQAKMKEAEDQFKSEVRKQGYDLSKIKMEYNSKVWEDSGMQSIADTERRTGIIVFHPDVFVTQGKGMTLKGIVAHELMHVKLTAYVNSHDMRKEEIANTTDMASLVLKGGVSGYSQSVWNRVVHGDADITVGIHETLAEMARIQAETGELPGDSVWKNFYKRVQTSYGKHG